MSIQAEAPLTEQPPEGLETYPVLTEAIHHHRQEYADFVTQLEAVTVDEAPMGYVRVNSDSIEDGTVANPHTATPLFLKRHGAPIVFTREEDTGDDSQGTYIVSWIAPEAEEAYKALWHETFDTPPRRLANDMARGRINPYDVLERSYQVVPIVNPYILWAHGQGILERAFVTSLLTQYERYGAGTEPGSISPETAGLIEEWIVEKTVLPFSLETVVAMGEAAVLTALTQHPELITGLGLEVDSLPTVDLTKTIYSDEQHRDDWDSYWGPLIEKLEHQQATKQ